MPLPASTNPGDRRKPGHRLVGAAAALALALGLAGAGCPGNAFAYTWPFTHYTESEGLPTSLVGGITQDQEGRIWVATRAGVASYDGAAWTLHDMSRGLPIAQHRDITVDHTGGIWAVAQPTPLRVSHLVNGRWETLPEWRGSIDGIEARELVAGRDGDGNVALAVLIQGKLVVVRARDQWWTVALPASAGVVHNICWQDRDLLVATEGGLYRCTDPGRPEAPAPLRVVGLPPGPVYAAVVEHGTGRLHIAGAGWYGEWSEGGFRYEQHGDELRLLLTIEGVDAAIDEIGGLYIGTPRSLFYLHPLLGVERLTQENGLLSSSLNDVLVDHEGVAWITSQRGIDKLPNRRLRSFTSADGLLDDEVAAVLQRRDGTIVLGHNDGVTYMTRPPRTQKLLAPGRDWSRAMDLFEDADGSLWVAMDQSGLAHLDARGSVRWYGLADGLEGAAYAVLRDRRGQLWAGTVGGIYRQVGDRFEHIDARNGPDGLRITARRFIEASDGALYVTTVRDGVIRVAGDQVTFLVAEPASGRMSTYAVYEPAPGVTWVGTSTGLCRVQEGRLEPTTAPDPVLSEPIYAITPDHDGNLWFGASRGLFRAAPARRRAARRPVRRGRCTSRVWRGHWRRI